MTTKHKLLFSLSVSYFVAYYYIITFMKIYDPYIRLNSLLFIGLFIVWVEILSSDNKKTKQDLLLMSSLIFLVINFYNNNQYSILYGSTMTFDVFCFNFILLHLVALTYVLSRFKYLSLNSITYLWFIDMIRAAIVIPFKNIFYRTTTIFKSLFNLSKGTDKFNLFLVFGVSSITLLVLIFTTNLLMSADQNFANVIMQLFHWDFVFLLNPFVILSIPVGAYLSGLINTCFINKQYHPNTTQVQATLTKFKIVPNTMLNFSLGMFIFIYVLYIFIQAEYLFSALFNVLPENFTYAVYARQGFFELCQIIVVNISILSLVKALKKKDTKSTTVLSMIIIFLSGLLLITAFSKLWFYIASYGLTSLRVLSSWWLMVLSLFLILFTRNLFNNKSYAKKMFNFTLISYMFISLLC